MDEAITICLSLGLAIAVFALNLRIQAATISNPTGVKKIINRVGYLCLCVGFVWILIGIFLLLYLKLPAWAWISIGITFVLLAFALIIEGKRLKEDDLNKFSSEIHVASYILLVIAVVIIIVFSIFRLLTISV